MSRSGSASQVASPAGPAWRRAWRGLLLAAGLPLLLAACGGGVGVAVGVGYEAAPGVSVGIGFSSSDYGYYGYGGDAVPDVSLGVSTPVAAAGQTVRLSATAYDDWGVVDVTFYLVRDDGSYELLWVDRSYPFVIDTVVPNSAYGEVLYFATVTDTSGQQRSSRAVAVQLVR
jgi:hypothetical protein